MPLELLPRRPPFPIHVLSPWLADWTAALAESTHTPLDLPGCLGLATVSAATAGNVVLKLHREWREQLSLYLMIGMGVSELKTPIYRAATEPLRRLESELIAASPPLIAAAKAERNLLRKRIAVVLRRATDAGGREEALNDELRHLEQELADHRIPVEPRLLAGDLTPEALAAVLAEQDGRLAIMSDEAELAEQLCGAHGRRGSVDLLLKGYDGSEYMSDRVGRGRLRIAEPVLTVAATVQPEVIMRLLEQRELGVRGLFGRMCFVLPESRVGSRGPSWDPPPRDVVAQYNTRMGDLLRLRRSADEKYLLAVTDAALLRLTALRQEIEPRLGPFGDLSGIGDFAGKHAGRVARLGALLHLARVGLVEPVPAEEIERAIELGDYFLEHCRAAREAVGLDPIGRAARRIAEWAAARESFSKKECFDALRRSVFEGAAELDAPLELLVRHSYIRETREEMRSGSGRKPSPRFTVNPALRDSRTIRTIRGIV